MRSIATLGVYIVLASTGHAGGSVDAGREFARQSCRSCHNVEAGAVFKEYPPSFASIAAFRSPEQIYGRIVFSSLHTGMPELGYFLTPQNVEDVVAYIVSLEGSATRD